MATRNSGHYTIEGPLQPGEKEEHANIPRGALKGVAVAGAVIALAAGISKTQRGGQPKENTPTMPYVIHQGDTEWSLAGKIAPNKDPREVADEIDQKLPHDVSHRNHTLQPGDVITYSDGHVTGYHSSSEGN